MQPPRQQGMQAFRYTTTITVNQSVQNPINRSILLMKISPVLIVAYFTLVPMMQNISLDARYL